MLFCNGRIDDVRGLTLIEVMVGSVVLSGAFLVTMEVIRSTSHNINFELVVADQQLQTRAAMDRIVDEMRRMSASVADFNSSTGMMNDTVAGINGALDAVTFEVKTYDAGSRIVTYRWIINETEIPGNNIDDDGNGLMDEDDGRLERFTNNDLNSITVVMTHVPRSSFRILKQGPRLSITLGKKNRTFRATQDGNNFSTTVTHVTYCLKN